MKDKIEKYKNFDKKTKENNKKLKVEGPNQNILYIQIKNQKLNWKEIKLQQQKITKKTTIKTKRSEFEKNKSNEDYNVFTWVWERN